MYAALFCFFHDVAGLVEQIVFDQGVADVIPLRLEKSKRHTAADKDLVDTREQVDQRFELAGDFAAADDSGERTDRAFDQGAEELDLFLEQETGSLVFFVKIMGDPLHRSMGAVADAERIVDEELGHARELLCQLLVVFRLALFKADILQEQHFVHGEFRGFFHGVFADDVVRQGDVAFEKLLEAELYRGKRILRVDLAFGAAHVRSEDNGAILVQAVVDGRQCRTDAAVVRNIAVFVHRDIEITPDKDFFSMKVQILNTVKLHLFSFDCTDV